MKESGYYPPGAERDPRAPYNEVVEECEVKATVSVEWNCKCSVHEIEEKYNEIEQFLANNEEVSSFGNLHTGYDDGDLSIWADVEVKVVATAFGNYITNPYPEPDEADIEYAVREQWEEILTIEGFNVNEL